MKYTFVIVLIILSTLQENIYGQCCSAGNPVGGDGSKDGLSKNEFRIFIAHKYSLSEEYYHYDSKSKLQYVDKSYFDYTSLSLTYGIWSKLSLHTELGYFFDKNQQLTINHVNEMIKAQGLGDLAFNIRYMPVKTIKPISELVISAGLKIPIGAFHEQIDGIIIPISLQPSSGALKYNLSTFYIHQKSGSKFGWSTFAFIEISQTINQGYLIYRYGNYFQYALAVTFSPTKSFTIMTNAKYEWRGKDKRENNDKIASTGSYVIIINPQLVYNFKHRFGVIAMADYPLYKYVNGYQLTNKFSFQIGIRKSFLFCKTKR